MLVCVVMVAVVSPSRGDCLIGLCLIGVLLMVSRRTGISRHSHCCLIAACDPVNRVTVRCRACGWTAPRTRPTPPAWVPSDEVVGVAASGELLVRKPDKRSSRERVGASMPDESFATEYPTITGYLCDAAYEDGTPRRPSALSLFCEDGCLKLALNDKDNERSLYVASDSLEGALATLEKALLTDNQPWRAWNDRTRKR